MYKLPTIIIQFDNELEAKVLPRTRLPLNLNNYAQAINFINFYLVVIFFFIILCRINTKNQ